MAQSPIVELRGRGSIEIVLLHQAQFGQRIPLVIRPQPLAKQLDAPRK